jgi:hypothetical protein
LVFVCIWKEAGFDQFFTPDFFTPQSFFWRSTPAIAFKINDLLYLVFRNF